MVRCYFKRSCSSPDPLLLSTAWVRGICASSYLLADFLLPSFQGEPAQSRWTTRCGCERMSDCEWILCPPQGFSGSILEIANDQLIFIRGRPSLLSALVAKLTGNWIVKHFPRIKNNFEKRRGSLPKTAATCIERTNRTFFLVPKL